MLTVFQTPALPIPETVADQGPVASLIYMTLVESPQPLTVDEIAEAITRPVTSVRRRSSDLANAGLVSRRPDPNDVRRNVYFLEM